MLNIMSSIKAVSCCKVRIHVEKGEWLIANLILISHVCDRALLASQQVYIHAHTHACDHLMSANLTFQY